MMLFWSFGRTEGRGGGQTESAASVSRQYSGGGKLNLDGALRRKLGSLRRRTPLVFKNATVSTLADKLVDSREALRVAPHLRSSVLSLANPMFRYGNRRALEEAADEHSAPRGEGSGDGGAAGSGAGEGFAEVEGAMVGINSVHVALSSVSAIQVHDRVYALPDGA